MKTYRHGDVDIIPTTKKGIKKIGGNGFVLAEGEATGHHHRIQTIEKTSVVEVFEGANGEMIVSVNGRATVTHPEHKTLEIETGTWEIKKEQEMDWFSLSVRRVID